MEPPGFNSSPSSVTIRREWRYFLAMAMAVIDVLYHQDAAQKILDQAVILPVCLHQAACQANDARLL